MISVRGLWDQITVRISYENNFLTLFIEELNAFLQKTKIIHSLIRRAIPSQNNERCRPNRFYFNKQILKRGFRKIIADSTFIKKDISNINCNSTTVTAAITSLNRLAIYADKIIMHIFINFCFIYSKYVYARFFNQ